MFETNNSLNTTNPSPQAQPIDIVFRNITYSVSVEDKTVEQPALPCRKIMTQKVLLKNLSGIFKAGTLTAIMGASGAGKTTLLNALACRIKSKTLSGEVFANGNLVTYEDFGDFANYVMQQDVLLQTLTVRETLEFAANLKLNASDEEKQARMSRLVKKMKL